MTTVYWSGPGTYIPKKEKGQTVWIKSRDTVPLAGVNMSNIEQARDIADILIKISEN